jgi:sugar lactone lactonase YvrE
MSISKNIDGGAKIASVCLIWIVLCGMVMASESSRTKTVQPSLNQYANDYFPVAQVKPGMKGYGLTVFKGTKIERFEVEVVGVLEQANFGRPLVLIKMYGGAITERGANIIAGMSGSPIYINGKILGAVAYGYSFPKEPHAMVTPLRDMLEALDPKLPIPSYLTESDSIPNNPFTPRTVQLTKPVRIGKQTFRQIHFSVKEPEYLGHDTAWAQPLMTPVMVSGLSQKNLKKLADTLEPYGLRPTMAPGGVGKPIQAQLRPGAALGGSLAIGDIDLTATGTLTYRKGNQIVAFGHPFLDLGAVEIPMTHAYIVDVFPSIASSFKMSNRAQTVGAIVQDRAFGVAGVVGQKARLMPVTVQVTDESTGRSGTFKCEMMSHPAFAPVLLGMASSEFISRVRYGVADTVAMVQWRLETEGAGIIERENLVFDSGDITGPAIQELFQLLAQLQTNLFQPVRIKSLNMNVHVRSARNTATVDRISVRETTYKPGDVVEVGVSIKPYNADMQTRTASIRLPRNLPNGRYVLHVSGGAPPLLPAGMPAELAMLLGGAGTSNIPVSNVQQIVKRFLERHKNNELIIRLYLNSSGVYIEGERLNSLPPVMRDVLRATKISNVRTEREEMKQVQSTDWVLSGIQTLVLNVQRPDMTDRVQPARPEFPTPPPGLEGGSPGFIPSDVYLDPDEEEPPGVLQSRSEFRIPSSVLRRQPPVPAPGEIPAEFELEQQPEIGETEMKPPGEDKLTAAPGAEKPVSRQVKRWQPTSYEVLNKGKMEGTTVTQSGKIQLSGRLRVLCRLPATYTWSMAADTQGQIYVGTGNQGTVYRIQPNGEFAEFVRLPLLTVNALCMGEQDTLYAAGAPGGAVYHLREGQVEKVWQGDVQYINVLLWAEGTLYIATGAPARIIALREGQASTLLSTEETHFTALARDAQGNLYAGTSDTGMVYRIDSKGGRVLYDSNEPSITALACDTQGNLYIGTHPRGNVYRLAPDGRVVALSSRAGWSVRGMVMQQDQLVIIASDRIYKANPASDDETLSQNFQSMGAQDAVEMLSAVAHGNNLYAGTANAGEVLTVEPVRTGTYESPVHDAKQIANWGYVRWLAEIPDDTTVQLQTRSGNTPEPDESWSGWSMAYTAPQGTRITSPPARFIQFRVILSQPEGSIDTPVLRAVSLSYLPKNQPPKLNLLEPKPYAVWSEKKTIRWSATDPDGDTLSYETLISPDGGKNWEALKMKPVAEVKTGVKEPGKPDGDLPTEEEIAAHLQVELDNAPGIPAEIREQIMQNLSQAAKELRAEMERMKAAGKPLPPELAQMGGSGSGSQSDIARASKVDWDTAQYPDGVYLVKVIATDKPSMPVDFYRVETVSALVIVCNTPPVLFVREGHVQVNAEKQASLNGVAFQYFSAKEVKPNEAQSEPRTPQETRNDVPIIAVQYRIGDSKDWSSAEPVDGFFDSGFEPFRITTDPLPAGEHTLEIKIFNSAGKTTLQKVKVNVPMSPK